MIKVLKHEATCGEARFASVADVLCSFASIKPATDPAAFKAFLASAKAESYLIVELTEAEVTYFFLGHGLGCFGITGRLDGSSCCAFTVDPMVALEVQSQAFRSRYFGFV